MRYGGGDPKLLAQAHIVEQVNSIMELPELPTTYEEAVEGPEGSKWAEAIKISRQSTPPAIARNTIPTPRTNPASTEGTAKKSAAQKQKIPARYFSEDLSQASLKE